MLFCCLFDGFHENCYHVEKKSCNKCFAKLLIRFYFLFKKLNECNCAQVFCIYETVLHLGDYWTLKEVCINGL